MIYYQNEWKFREKTASNFEGYMFATTDRHIERHTQKSLDHMQIGIFGPEGCDFLKCVPDQKQRRMHLTEFNQKMRDHGVDPMQKANKLRMCYLVLDEFTEITKPSAALEDFCVKKNKVAVMVLHYEQRYADNDQYNVPHVHVIYDSKAKLPKQELIEFLTTEYTGLFSPVP